MEHLAIADRALFLMKWAGHDPPKNCNLRVAVRRGRSPDLPGMAHLAISIPPGLPGRMHCYTVRIAVRRAGGPYPARRYGPILRDDSGQIGGPASADEKTTLHPPLALGTLVLGHFSLAFLSKNLHNIKLTPLWPGWGFSFYIR
jgi:hypothetical protein